MSSVRTKLLGKIREAALLSQDGLAKTRLVLNKFVVDEHGYIASKEVFGCGASKDMRGRHIYSLSLKTLKELLQSYWTPNIPCSPLELLAKFGDECKRLR